MLAIIEALQEWRQYLLGASSPTEVWSDHLNLTYYQKPQNLSKRQANWISELADYDFTIHHLLGKLNNKADALSCRPDYTPSESDNQSILGLPNSLFQNLDTSLEDGKTAIAKLTHPQSDLTIQSGRKDHPNDWEISSYGICLFHGKIYIPGASTLHHEILLEYHDTPIAGHPGKTRMWENIEQSYWERGRVRGPRWGGDGNGEGRR